MATGLFFVLAGVLILIYPAILIAMIAGILIMMGLGIMAMSWNFRRLRKHHDSQVANWIFRY